MFQTLLITDMMFAGNFGTPVCGIFLLWNWAVSVKVPSVLEFLDRDLPTYGVTLGCMHRVSAPADV